MDDLERASAAGREPMEGSLQMLESRQLKRSRGQNEFCSIIRGVAGDCPDLLVKISVVWSCLLYQWSRR